MTNQSQLQSQPQTQPRSAAQATLPRRRFIRSGAGLAAAAALPLAALSAGAHADAPGAAPTGPADLKRLVTEAHRRFAGEHDGKNADYIPYLAGVPSQLFGIAIVDRHGGVATAGDANTPFAIESIAKVFNLALVMAERGADRVRDKLGASATGLPFNSVMALELHGGKPLSPLVNAGAMATVSFVAAGSASERWSKVFANMKRFAGADLSLNAAVYQSEAATNQHNRAIAYLLQSAGYMYSDPIEACDVYTRACSVNLTARDLAMMGGVLANNGVHPVSGTRLLDGRDVPKLLAEMAMEGMYDTSGDWLYDVGLPAKSGVGGGIVAVAPGRLAIAAFSPPLDTYGNSVRAQKAIAWIADQLGLNVLRVA
ncbi:glutaminase A [Burkholderia plantarii]|uniref:Glutaminase n=1 Tax=Burkholderia plantarii TaxID=41899 RepID=A0A0B6RSV1_BURPL|nr:glutaminase A [Burkholderia plantarii]AJK45244.1 glutaminase GlsA [Burkholderia plantarii]WLE58227.1 glutaminase A [Burkholderia plantarii]